MLKACCGIRSGKQSDVRWCFTYCRLLSFNDCIHLHCSLLTAQLIIAAWFGTEVSPGCVWSQCSGPARWWEMLVPSPPSHVVKDLWKLGWRIFRSRVDKVLETCLLSDRLKNATVQTLQERFQMISAFGMGPLFCENHHRQLARLLFEPDSKWLGAHRLPFEDWLGCLWGCLNLLCTHQLAFIGLHCSKHVFQSAARRNACWPVLTVKNSRFRLYQATLLANLFWVQDSSTFTDVDPFHAELPEPAPYA